MVLIIKIVIVVTIAVLIRGTLPRYRVDQFISSHWKLLVFLFITFIFELLMMVYAFPALEVMHNTYF